MRTAINIALVIVVAVLAVWLAFLRQRQESRIEGAVLPGLSSKSILSISKRSSEVGDRQEDWNVGRSKPGEPFGFVSPREGRVDQRRLRTLMSALELLAYKRRESGETAQRAFAPERGSVTIVRKDLSFFTLSVGQDSPGSSGTWLRVSSGADFFLVDSHAASELLPSAEDLRDRHPFAELPASEWTVYKDDSVWVRDGDVLLEVGEDVFVYPASPNVMTSLRRALQELRVESFSESGPAERTTTISITYEGQRRLLVIGGECPENKDQVWVDTEVGAGCMTREGVDSVLSAFEAKESWLDTRLFGGECKSLRFQPNGEDGFTVANPNDWLAAVTAKVSWRPQRIGQPILRKLSLVPEGATDRAAEFAETTNGMFLLASGNPGWGFPVSDGVDIAPEPWQFSSLQLTSVGPYEVQTVRRVRNEKDETVKRGEVLEDWLVMEPSGRVANAQALAGVVERFAGLDAISVVATKPSGKHGLDRLLLQLAFSADPAGTERVPVSLRIGKKTRRGCYAQVIGNPFVYEIDSAACKAATNRWLEN